MITSTRGSGKRRRAPSRPHAITSDIVSPRVNDRVYQHFDRVQGPARVEDTVHAALNGDPLRQMLLFNAMIDTWPDLGQALNQICDEAASVPLVVEPFSMDGDEPSPVAEDKASVIRELKRSMRPDLRGRREGWVGTLKGFGMGYFYGLTVREVFWEQTEGGIFPVSTAELDPVYYRYPINVTHEDELLFSPNGRTGGFNLEQFHPDKHIVAESRWHRGGILQTAPLRPLIGFWLAMTYGLKWLMQFSQNFGVPFRLGKYPLGDDKTKLALEEALMKLGTGGYGAAPEGTSIDVTPLPASAQSLPQAKLIELANNAVAKFILGQTLTSDVGKSGSRALGDVHANIRRARVRAVVQFNTDIINFQMVPSINRANWPDCSELPTVAADLPDEEDEQAMVERDKVLFVDMGLPVAIKDLYKRHKVRKPEDGDELFQVLAPSAPGALPGGAPQPGNPGSPKPEDIVPEDPPEGEVQARRLQWYSRLGSLFGGSGRKVQAQSATLSTLDLLQENVAQSIPSVSREWLAAASDLFEGLERRALSGDLTPEEFQRVLEEALLVIPDLELNVEALEEALVNAIGTAVVAGGGQKALDLPKISV